MNQTPTRRVTKTAAQLAAQLVRGQLDSVKVLESIVDNDLEGFEALLEALTPAAERDCKDQYSRLRAELPEHLRPILLQVSDAMAVDSSTRLEAGFLVGLHVGMLLAGGGR